MSSPLKNHTTARCACGSVEIEAIGDPIVNTVCYCESCQEGSTSRKDTGCRYTERHYREICRPWRCAFTQSLSPQAVIFQVTYPATQLILSSSW